MRSKRSRSGSRRVYIKKKKTRLPFILIEGKDPNYDIWKSLPITTKDLRLEDVLKATRKTLTKV